MLTYLAQRRDVASVAAAIDEQRTDPGGARALDVLVRRIPDVQGLIGADTGQLEGLPEDRGVRLAMAGVGGAHRSIDQLPQPDAVEHRPQRAVPVGDADQPRAHRSQVAQRRGRVGERSEADRGDQLVGRDRHVELLRDERGAAVAKVRQGGVVAPLVSVIAVVGHLRAHRVLEPFVAHLGWDVRAQREPGRLQLDQGAEGVEEDSAGHLWGILPDAMMLAAADPSFWQQHGDEISAAITLAVAVVIAVIVDRLLIGRAVQATMRMETGQLSREARTRLRLIRRLLFLTIILIGVALALSQFTSIKRFATGVLASTAVLGIIIGFAGRQVIANLVSGVLIAITQPIRIGDLVSIGDEVHGRVTDIALTYTRVDAGDGSLIVVPNEKVATDVVVNHSAGNSAAPVTVDVWLPPDADVEAARKELEKGEVTSARLVEITPEGAKVQVKAALDAGVDREAHEAELRERAQSVLRAAGLIGG